MKARELIKLIKLCLRSKTLNAPFTLWLLTALLLSIGGTVLNSQQQCRLESEQLIEKHRKLKEEVFERRTNLYNSIFNARSIKELRSSESVKHRDAIYQFREFKGMSINDLQEELDKIYVQMGEIPFGIDFTISENEALFQDKAKDNVVGVKRVDGFNYRLGDADFSKASDQTLPKIKALAVEEYKALQRADIMFKTGVPQCGCLPSIKRLLLGGPVALLTNSHL